MHDQLPPKTHGTLPPETALSLLANEVRASILWTLSEARNGQGPPLALLFSELRERAAPEVDSSRFNYHLQQLVGPYVERADADSVGRAVPEMAGPPETGYQLTQEGTTLVRTVRAWSSPTSARRQDITVNQSCYHCDTPLKARYQNAVLAVECPNCHYLYDYNLTPPGVLDDDDAVLLQRAAEYNRHIRLSFARGICPYCANEVDAEFQYPSETGYPRGNQRAVLIRRGCTHCGNKDNLTVGELLLREPELISFCFDRGLDVTRTPIWGIEFAATDRCTTVRSQEPWKVAVAVELDDERLTLAIDESLAVIERVWDTL